MPKKELPDDRLSLLVVPINEAINWVAFGEFGSPGLGPQLFFSLPITKEGLQRIYATDEARSELAAELILARAASGDLRTLGREMTLLRDDSPEAEKGFEEYWDDPKGDYVDIPASAFSYGRFDDDHDGMIETETKAYGDMYVIYGDLIRAFPNREDGKLENSSSNAGKGTSKFIRSNRGRPRKWDWDAAHREIIRIAAKPDGLPKKQADLEKIVANWFVAGCGDQPVSSDIRRKISPIYKMLKAGR